MLFRSYTAHGDAINTAARLESVNKHLGTRLCVSGSSREQCGDALSFRPVADLVLMGKTEALPVFEPLSDDFDVENLRDYEQCFALMREQDAQAAAQFAALAERYPADPLAAYHARRLASDESGIRIVMDDK